MLWTIGNFHALGVMQQDARNIETFVLDSNVVIDIRDFYNGKADKRTREDLRLLLMKLSVPQKPHDPAPRMIYGFGVGETCISRWHSQPDWSQWRWTAAACGEVLDWDLKQVEQAFANRHPPVNRRKMLPPIEIDQQDVPDPMLWSTYARLLKLGRLTQGRKFGKDWNQRVSVYEEWLRWSDRVLRMVDFRESQIAFDMLLGSGDANSYFQPLLKLGGSETTEQLQANCWNAAWDLQMLRTTEMIHVGALGNPPTTTALVTKDKGMAELRQRGGLIETNRFGSTLVGVGQLDTSMHPGYDLHMDRIDHLHEQIAISQGMRLAFRQHPNISALNAAIRDAEEGSQDRSVEVVLSELVA